MKAKELARYLAYVDDDIDLKVITSEEYRALMAIVVAYNRARNALTTETVDLAVSTFRKSTWELPIETNIKDI